MIDKNTHSMNPTTSIIIVNFNGKHYLKTCLDAVFAQSVPQKNYEVILVDNNSSDGSVSFITENYPQVKLIESSKNLGFAAGNNLGVEHAQGEFVALLNNDTQVDKDWLSFLLKTIQKDDQIAAVNSKTILRSSAKNKDQQIQNAGNIVFKSGYSRDRGAIVENGTQSYETDTAYFDEETEVPAFCGVSVLLRKKLYQLVGGFDESLFMYYEDVDMSMTLGRLGYKIIYQPQSTLIHVHAGSSSEWSTFFTYHVEKNHLLFTAKHYPLLVVLQQITQHKLLIALTFFRAAKSLITDFEKSGSLFQLALVRTKALLWFQTKIFSAIQFRNDLHKREVLSLTELYRELY